LLIQTKDAIRDGSEADVEDLKAEIDKQKKAKQELREEVKKRDREIAKLNAEIDNLQEQ
jgi:Skp family chaperone for outer membrane proteins